MVGIVAILINIFSGIITGFVPQGWVDTLKKPAEWAFQNPVIITLIFIIFLLLMLVFYQGSRRAPGIVAAPSENAVAPSPVPSAQSSTNQLSSDKDVEGRYLQRMARETELLRLTGIPAGLVAPSVPLDDVFIPLEFFPRRLPSDYPLTLLLRPWISSVICPYVLHTRSLLYWIVRRM